MSDLNGKSDEDSRKLFLGGLPASAGKQDLESYFSSFGELEMVTIKTDPYTGHSRGFGFIIFKDKSSVSAVLSAGANHDICGKSVEAKLAKPQTDEKSAKVFVGGLDRSTTAEQIKSVFNQRGNVVDVFLPVDHNTNEAKGFAFVTFDESSIASTLCAEGKFIVEGKECDIKPAKNKNESRGGGRGGFRGGRGGFQGRGGGRGGYGGGYDQYGGGGYGGGGYDQYSGYNNGYSGGYGGQNYGGYDQYGGAGYGPNSGYGGGSYGDSGYGSGYGGPDQYKMKGNRGGRGGYTPY